MSSNSSAPAPDPTASLPPYLNLPPHLSAHKYFFVCTLTVAAWDTLVLSPRTWRLFRTKEWPPLKIAFYMLRFLMPIEFIIVAVAFFDTKWTSEMCQKFFLFEPILTAILVSVCAAVHVVRIRAIYAKNRGITSLLSGLLTLQLVLMGVACGFYHVVPVQFPSQGCIAGPKHNWVGIYWVAPTLFFSTSFALALARSFQSRQQKSIGLWKLMLRDGLNLYGAVWIVNMINMLFWFIAKPTGPEDTIKTIVTSMTAVLTITMTMRIILSVRGTLVAGGSFAGSSTGAHSSSGGTQRSAPPAQGAVFSINPASAGRPTYMIDEMRSGGPGVAGEGKWEADGDKSSLGAGLVETKTEDRSEHDGTVPVGVKVTIERDFD